MLTRMNIHKWLMSAWMILLSCTLCSAQVSTSMQSTSTMLRTNYSGSTNTITQSAPTYRFQSTSTYQSAVRSSYSPSVNAPFAGSPTRYGVRKSSNPWDEDYNPEGDEENEGIGVAHEVPLGDTPWLLMALLALLYVGYKKHRASKATVCG